MNPSTFEKLQYNELKEMVKTYCVSGLGKQLIDKLVPSSSIKVVQTRLNETTEGRRILDAEGHVPFAGVSNVEHLVQKVEKRMILDPEELVRLSDFLRGCRRIKRFMSEREFSAPVLASYANSMTELMEIEEEINFSIKGNKVSSEASRELKRIRHHMELTEEKVKDRLNKFLNNSGNSKYIQEFFISKKDDRYTIPIKASFKNHVQGVVVEISSKGSTVFMEPSSVSKLSAELAMLHSEEAMVEYQILATLTGLLAEQLGTISVNMELIAQYDMVFAKAKFSRQIDGVAPRVNDYGKVKLVACKHPLLTGAVVPLDFEIGVDYRSLVITGPNAGGKTIVLKTIGLVTLAVMSGFHVHADPMSEVAIFDQVFVDIGDNQSLENALSTFSSHMKNLSEVLRVANNNTLLLFDEIGSGTEPNEGAALAIAILEEFYLKGCITVATTHYGEIKRYSEEHPDFMNAAMQFNNETLEPLYRLIIGRSGESNALWISRKMEIPDGVLAKAEQYISEKSYDYGLVQDSKKRKPRTVVVEKADEVVVAKGDRVKLLDRGEMGIVYEERDQYRNVKVFVEGDMVEVNERRLALETKAADLYPEGYDLDTLFVDYKTRKLNHDIARGSKKALRKIHKEIRDAGS